MGKGMAGSEPEAPEEIEDGLRRDIVTHRKSSSWLLGGVSSQLLARRAKCLLPAMLLVATMSARWFGSLVPSWLPSRAKFLKTAGGGLWATRTVGFSMRMTTT